MTAIIVSSLTATATKKRLFGHLVFFTTLLTPVVVYLLLNYKSPDDQFSFLPILVAIGGAHQAASAYFYADKQIYQNIHHVLWRFFLMPVILVMVMAMLYISYPLSFERSIIDWAVGFVTLHHYQKQNLGLYSIHSSIHDPGVKITHAERMLAMSGLVVGVMAAVYPLMGYSGTDVFWKNIYAYSRWASVLVMCICVISVAIIFVRRLGDRSNPGVKNLFFKYAFLMMCSAYYLPFFLCDNPVIGFLISIASHATQYYLIMFFVAMGQESETAESHSRRRVFLYAVSNVAILVFLTSAVSFLSAEIDFLPSLLNAEERSGELVGGVMAGLVFTHFYLDSKVWRLQQPDARAYMKRRLSFLFS